MIRVDVRFFATVRALTNEYQVTVFLPEKSSVLDLLHSLTPRYGSEFGDYIFLDESSLNKHVVIIKNGRGIGILDGLGTMLQDGDSISIMPAVGGG